MHPNPLFHSDDRAMIEAMIAQVGVGTVFGQTRTGPCAARTPLIVHGAGRLQYHLAKSNPLVDGLDGGSALVTVDGPDGYISPRWYAKRDTVPTWNYVSVEAVGTVRKLDDDELEAFLHRLIDLHENRLGGDRWDASEASTGTWGRLFGGIAGFELQVEAYRPTIKLSQDKPAEVRRHIAAGLEAVEGIDSVEVAGPGFINIRLDAAAAGALAKTIVEAGDGFGTTDARADEIINLAEPALRCVGLGPRTHVRARPELSRQVGENKAGCDRIDAHAFVRPFHRHAACHR